MISNTSEDNNERSNKEGALKPDAETLHTTDPEEHMEGPLSSLMNKLASSSKKEEFVDTDENKRKGD